MFQTFYVPGKNLYNTLIACASLLYPSSIWALILDMKKESILSPFTQGRTISSQEDMHRWIFDNVKTEFQIIKGLI